MSGRGQQPTRRAVKALSLQGKIDAIDRVHNGESKASVARDIGVPESTLRGWCKGEEKLRHVFAQSDAPSQPPVKVPRLADTPLDFSMKQPTSKYEPTSPVPTHVSKGQEDVTQEAFFDWMQRGQATLPKSPLEGRTADNTAGWFWKLYKNHGILPLASQVSEDKDYPSDEEHKLSITKADAVHHGEQFLRWLESCSDPNVTALQILQFRYLLKNIKECAERRSEARVNDRRRK